MHTNRIREWGRNEKYTEEAIVGIAVLVLLVVCGLANAPIPTHMTSKELSFSLGWEKQRVAQIQELRTRDSTLEGEVKKLSKALETSKADLASFRQVHDTLIAQLATATAKLQELEGIFQNSKVQEGKLKEYVSLQEQLKKERDEALNQAKDAADRIRELTLRLQRAGVYP